MTHGVRIGGRGEVSDLQRVQVRPTRTKRNRDTPGSTRDRHTEFIQSSTELTCTHACYLPKHSFDTGQGKAVISCGLSVR